MGNWCLSFFQVMRPDGQKEQLGLAVLDEPASKQSDPSVLELQLRAISKQSSQKAAQVSKSESDLLGFVGSKSWRRTKTFMPNSDLANDK